MRTSERNDSLDKRAKELSERQKACALREGEMEGASRKLEEKERDNDAKLKALEDEAQT